MKNFSFFNAPISNNIPSASITLLDLYGKIKSDGYAAATQKYRGITDAKEANAYKTSAFDYVTFCGAFSRRNDASLILPSGYMVLDIDKQANVDTIKEQLAKDTELDPLLMFTSPSGNGLKVVVEIDKDLIEIGAPSRKLHNVWQVVNNYIAIKYSHVIEPDAGGHFIDPSGCDLSRACFICHDTNCFINPKILK